MEHWSLTNHEKKFDSLDRYSTVTIREVDWFTHKILFSATALRIIKPTFCLLRSKLIIKIHRHSERRRRQEVNGTIVETDDCNRLRGK